MLGTGKEDGREQKYSKTRLPSQANMGIGAEGLLGGTFKFSPWIYLMKSLQGSEECSSLGVLVVEGSKVDGR
jgi:hypothetical protein